MIEPLCPMFGWTIKSIESNEQFPRIKLIRVPDTKISSSRNLWKNLEIEAR
jgi:hypothetical protein